MEYYLNQLYHHTLTAVRDRDTLVLEENKILLLDILSECLQTSKQPDSSLFLYNYSKYLNKIVIMFVSEKLYNEASSLLTSVLHKCQPRYYIDLSQGLVEFMQAVQGMDKYTDLNKMNVLAVLALES